MDAQLNDKKKTVLNWSSGKDAALAFHMLDSGNEYKVTHLLTTVNDESNRIVMHGVRESLLTAQAQRMHLPLKKIMLPAAPEDDVYSKAMAEALWQLKEEGIATAAFGDIFLEDLRNYREQQLQTVGINAVFPLWKLDTRKMIGLLEDVGIETVIVCVNEQYLGKDFLGRKVNRQLLADLPPNVDPCGENGEFHTFVYNAPFFSSPVPVSRGEVVYKNYGMGNGWDTGFYFMDLQLQA